MLKESVHFKMAHTEVIRVAVVTISEVLFGEFARIIKKEEDKEEKALVGEELGHTASFISSQKTVSFSEPKQFWDVYVVCFRSTSFRLPDLHQLCRVMRSMFFYFKFQSLYS